MNIFGHEIPDIAVIYTCGCAGGLAIGYGFTAAYYIRKVRKLQRELFTVTDERNDLKEQSDRYFAIFADSRETVDRALSLLRVDYPETHQTFLAAQRAKTETPASDEVETYTGT